MAGVAGLEPANAGVKVLCLTNLAIPQYGVPGEIRIRDTVIKSHVLCLLSYRRI